MAEVRAPRDESDWDGYTEVLVRSFGADAETWRTWFDGPRDHAIVRLAVDGGRVVAGAAALPVGQRFGGRVVPAAGVAAVSAAPEARGRGAAGQVLEALAAAAREAGILVAPLWSARTTVYRRAGWELAGRAHAHAVELERLRGLGGRGEAVLDPGGETRALQAALVERFDGPLERPEWWWRWRYERDRPHPRERVGWVEDGRLTGFASFERAPSDGGYVIGVHELWTGTREALGGLAGFLASHASIAPEVRLYQRAAPETPDLAWLLPPGTVRTEARDPWMLRLLDPAAALAARGWPRSAAVRLELEVADPWRPGPERLRLEVEGGEARTSPVGEGRVRLGVGALAAWYAGALPPTRAARLGLAAGPAADLLAMDALTGDRPVWLPDAF
jgi:predicted acetyltransferase